MAAALLVTACGFEDPTPETLTFRMDGPAGTPVDFIFSKYFVAGTNELGETLVSVAQSDTVRMTLPVDTVFDIVVEKRWLVLALPVEGDGIDVDVSIDVNDRNLVREEGKLYVDPPWRFVYMFNQMISESVDVVF